MFIQQIRILHMTILTKKLYSRPITHFQYKSQKLYDLLVYPKNLEEKCSIKNFYATNKRPYFLYKEKLIILSNSSKIVKLYIHTSCYIKIIYIFLL